MYGDVHTPGGYGVEGQNYATFGTGILGQDIQSGGIGVSGNGAEYGVYGNGGAYGAYATTISGDGVHGYSQDGNGVYGDTYDGFAGYFHGDVNITGVLYTGGCSGCSSDERLKKNIEPLDDAVERLLSLKGVTFEWKNPDEHQNRTGRQVGVIAQQVETVFPQWVKEDRKGFKTVDPDERTVLALSVEAVRSLKEKNDALEARVKAIENGQNPNRAGQSFGGADAGILALAAAIAFAATQIKKKNEKSA